MRVTILSEDVYLPEPVGKQPKYWILSYGKRFLFKEGTLKQDKIPVYNDVSECMAQDIGSLLKIPMAQYCLCEDENKTKGVITIDFLDNKTDGPKKEEFFDGVYLISLVDPGFKNGSLENPKTHQMYTLDLVLQSVERFGLQKQVLEMMIFDALIANRDRNPSNYGVIVNHETGKVKFAPLYDNATSLGVSMVDHRLEKCIDKEGNIVDENWLNTVIHKHIVGKITLERFLQYKEKREWDFVESKRIMDKIDAKKIELWPLVEQGKMSVNDYHKELYKVGNEYRKFDVSTLQYQSLIAHLTNFYPEEIEDIMTRVENAITVENVDRVFSFYEDELPKDRLKMAKEIVLRRAKWMTEYYKLNKKESRGKALW